jgi:hypothetical protein
MSPKYSNDQKPTVARKEETSRVVWVLVFVTNLWTLVQVWFSGKKNRIKEPYVLSNTQWSKFSKAKIHTC